MRKCANKRAEDSRNSGIESTHLLSAESNSATICCSHSWPTTPNRTLDLLIEYCRYVSDFPERRGRTSHNSTERESQNLVEFQVQDKRRHERRFPFRLFESLFRIRMFPVFIITFNRKFKIEAIQTNQRRVALKGSTYSSSWIAHGLPSAALTDRSMQTKALQTLSLNTKKTWTRVTRTLVSIVHPLLMALSDALSVYALPHLELVEFQFQPSSSMTEGQRNLARTRPLTRWKGRC